MTKDAAPESSGRQSVELEGYLTSVTRAGAAPELYLHTAESTLRVVLEPAAAGPGTPGAAGVPLGPAARVRVRGRVQGAVELPTLRAVWIEPAPGDETRKSRK